MRILLTAGLLLGSLVACGGGEATEPAVEKAAGKAKTEKAKTAKGGEEEGKSKGKKEE